MCEDIYSYVAGLLYCTVYTNVLYTVWRCSVDIKSINKRGTLYAAYFNMSYLLLRVTRRRRSCLALRSSSSRERSFSRAATAFASSCSLGPGCRVSSSLPRRPQAHGAPPAPLRRQRGAEAAMWCCLLVRRPPFSSSSSSRPATRPPTMRRAFLAPPERQPL